MWQAILKVLLLAGGLYLPLLQQQTAYPRNAEEWEMCLRNHNPQGYTRICAGDPEDLMERAHWQLYLDSYTMEAFAFAPKIWRLTLHYKDVQLLLRAHKDQQFRNTLTDSQQRALARAETLVSQLTLPEMSPYTKACILHDFLVTTCTYTQDPESAKNATDMLLLRRGACEAFGRALQLLLEIAGVPCQLVYGTDPNNVRHCWNKALLNGRWLYIDPAWDAIDSTPHSPSHTYFAIPAEPLRATHTWDEE